LRYLKNNKLLKMSVICVYFVMWIPIWTFIQISIWTNWPNYSMYWTATIFSFIAEIYLHRTVYTIFSMKVSSLAMKMNSLLILKSKVILLKYTYDSKPNVIVSRYLDICDFGSNYLFMNYQMMQIFTTFII